MVTKQYRQTLIDEVKKYPVLYDTQHENHRDIDVRDMCWAQIADKLGENSEVLKHEWKILRDSLRQSLKKVKKGATTKAGAPCKTWRFQNSMAFLLPYMTKRSSTRKTPSDLKIQETEESSLQEDTEMWNSPGGEHESLELFFASVCQSTKHLPKKHQAKVKRQVLEVLLRVEEEFEGEVATDGDTKAGIF